MRIIFHIIIFGFFSVFPSAEIFGQLFCPDANFTDSTNYTLHPVQYPVYVYNTTPGNPGEISGALIAEGPSDTIQWEFQWSIFNLEDAQFEELKTETGETSMISGLQTGGYRLRLSNGVNFDSTFYAWIFINSIDLRIEKDSDGEIKLFKYTCNYLDLNAVALSDTLFYYDFTSGEQLVLFGKVDEIEWTWETDDEKFDLGSSATRFLDIRTYSPPVEDTRFFLTITDNYGARDNDEVFYETINVRAEFDFEYELITDTIEKYYTNKDQTTVPQTITLTGEPYSTIIEYEWAFGDDTVKITTDSVISHTYYYPGVFDVVLTVRSAEECEDSTSLEVNVNDEKGPELELPNFFYVDGQNRFRTYDVSVSDFHIVIFSRWGKRVHEFEGNIRNWEGWDGRIKNSNAYAAEGVYYYVILTSIGIEDKNKLKKWDKDIYRGFFHLYRSQSL